MECTGPRLIRSLEDVQAYIGDPSVFELHSSIDKLEDYERYEAIQDFCIDLIRVAKVGEDHFKQIDLQFSSLLSDRFSQIRSPSVSEPTSNYFSVYNEAISLLSRLPSVPQRLFSLPLHSTRTSGGKGILWDSIRDGTWASKYVVEEARSKFSKSVSDPKTVLLQLEEMQDLAWENMFVTSFIDTNNLVLILKICAAGKRPDLCLAHQLRNYVDLLSEILCAYESVRDLANIGFPRDFDHSGFQSGTVNHNFFYQDHKTHEQELQIVQIFLWSAWQRTVMLLFYYIVGVQLWQGPSSEWSELLSVHGLYRLEELGISDYRGEDCDLQSVGIDDSSIVAYETLFSVFLVCDWGVRAWTMLEAIRGSQSTHILCKREKTIALKTLFQEIHRYGAVDLAVLLGNIQHLLPSSNSKSTMDVEEVGHLLSQRHASRVDDEIIIWALLSSEQVPKNALDFWGGHEKLNTAFLVSSAPRIQGHLGYGWCPDTPYIRPQERFIDLGKNLKQYYT
ncbi:MAG: hypothetical protein LQ342_008570, partial [Letrouitia transgressa]